MICDVVYAVAHPKTFWICVLKEAVQCMRRIRIVPGERIRLKYVKSQNTRTRRFGDGVPILSHSFVCRETL
jgi:hypothetical protein